MGRPVDHRKIAQLVLRRGGQHYDVLCRYCDHADLSAADKQKIRALLEGYLRKRHAVEQARIDTMAHIRRLLCSAG